MKAEIESALGQLIVLPIWAARRACDLAAFQIGEHRIVAKSNGGTKTVGTWALHMQCAWRIHDARKVLVTSSDCYQRADHLLNSKEIFNWDMSGANQ